MEYLGIVAIGIAVSLAAVFGGVWLAGGAEAVRRLLPSLIWLLPLMVLMGVIVVAARSTGLAAALAALGALLLGYVAWRSRRTLGTALRAVFWLVVVLDAALPLALFAAALNGRV